MPLIPAIVALVLALAALAAAFAFASVGLAVICVLLIAFAALRFDAAINGYMPVSREKES